MSQARQTLQQIYPGPLVEQRNAVVALLQRAFPPSRFQFKDLPAKVDRASWNALTQGNQPFLGLGFNGLKPASGSAVYDCNASWTLMLAVRGTGDPKVRFLGDAQGVGVLSLLPVAIAVLHGQMGATGTMTLKAASNVVAEGWADDCAIVGVEIEIPMRLRMFDMVTPPAELGLFKEMLEQWAAGTPAGSADTFVSDWKNPND